ncbi:hypothetical protein B0H16DRAFT_1483910 [Mycena metata]|uniref:Uncharacterized protein n=1 Tax=Mycena metata TaxID=1033252 RepID=A0AAD7DVZ1_9AGAR|nr:hypothetical protein B0H16DRAFT_1483910 [Mycena metata]
MASTEGRTSTCKRPRTPLLDQFPGPRHGLHEAELAGLKRGRPFFELRDEAGASGVHTASVVTERSRKRRKIITVVIPEREIKQEETPPISLSGPSLHCSSSSPSRGFPLVWGNDYISSTPPPLSEEEAQQPTPPASQRADIVDSVFGSSLVAPSQQPTPPATPSSAATETGFLFEMGFLSTSWEVALPPPPTLSWPARVVDYETYELAAASTQALIDYYLDPVKFTLAPEEGSGVKPFLLMNSQRRLREWLSENRADVKIVHAELTVLACNEFANWSLLEYGFSVESSPTVVILLPWDCRGRRGEHASRATRTTSDKFSSLPHP